MKSFVNNKINKKRGVFMGKDIKIVNGNGSEIEISPVYDHLNSVKPKTKKDEKKIVIPEEKKK